MLGAAGLISKLLWPIQASAQKRGAGLRHAIGIDSLPILEGRGVRDSCEHFDARIDAYFASGRTNVVDRNLGPKDMIDVPDAVFCRHIDSAAGTIGVMNRELVWEEVSLRDLMDALLIVRRGADAWMATHGSD